jgi:outer membrane protein TolC
MKHLFIILFQFPVLLFAQDTNLSLEQAYELAQQNYPLIKQRDLIRQTSGLISENLGKAFLPQLSLNGQASYQSDVTSINLSLPGTGIQPLSKDQYRIVTDLNQLVYDGGVIKQQKNIQQLNEEVSQQTVEVALYNIKDRINQLFLGVLFIDEQLKQTELVKGDLEIGIKNVEALVNNGVSFRSNLDMLKAELLGADQHTIELRSARKGLLDVMSLFINKDLPENTILQKPVPGITVLTDSIERPELHLFLAQKNQLSGQLNLINARNRPKASLFWEGGYGRPALNLLKNEFAFFYTTGFRMNWAFGGFYTQKKEKKIIELNQKSIELQKKVFLLNTNTQLKQQESEIDKLAKLIDTDKGIITLRYNVKEAARAQLENGVITANDYLKEVNAENQARQNLIIHNVQLLQAQINYQTIKGKQ